MCLIYMYMFYMYSVAGLYYLIKMKTTKNICYLK